MRVAALVCMLAPALALAQSGDAIDVTGRVVDKRGRPVTDAAIELEGQPPLARTDSAGRFRVHVPIGTALVIEHDGQTAGLASVTGPVLDDILLLDVDESGE